MATRATVLPARFKGQNSWLFQLVSHISPTLRLSLLMQEAGRRIGSEVEAHIGDAVAFETLRGLAHGGGADRSRAQRRCDSGTK